MCRAFQKGQKWRCHTCGGRRGWVWVQAGERWRGKCLLATSIFRASVGFPGHQIKITLRNACLPQTDPRRNIIQICFATSLIQLLHHINSFLVLSPLGAAPVTLKSILMLRSRLCMGASIPQVLVQYGITEIQSCKEFLSDCTQQVRGVSIWLINEFHNSKSYMYICGSLR